MLKHQQRLDLKSLGFLKDISMLCEVKLQSNPLILSQRELLLLMVINGQSTKY